MFDYVSLLHSDAFYAVDDFDNIGSTFSDLKCTISTSYVGMMPFDIAHAFLGEDTSQRYFCAQKIDGIKASLIYYNKKCYCLLRNGELFVKEVDISSRNRFVVDVEMTDRGLYLLDYCVIDSSHTDPFKIRLGKLRALVRDISIFFSFPIFCQNYRNVNVVLREYKLNPIDDLEGFILIDFNGKYNAGGRYTSVYKWKLPRLCSFDLSVCEGDCMTSDGKIVFANTVLSDGIYEFFFDGSYKMRKDKIHANSSETCGDVYTSYQVDFDYFYEMCTSCPGRRNNTFEDFMLFLNNISFSLFECDGDIIDDADRDISQDDTCVSVLKDYEERVQQGKVFLLSMCDDLDSECQSIDNDMDELSGADDADRFNEEAHQTEHNIVIDNYEDSIDIDSDSVHTEEITVNESKCQSFEGVTEKPNLVTGENVNVKKISYGQKAYYSFINKKKSVTQSSDKCYWSRVTFHDYLKLDKSSINIKGKRKTQVSVKRNYKYKKKIG